MTLVQIGRLGKPHGVHGEQALNGVALTPHELHTVRTFKWRGTKGESRTLILATARAALPHMLVRFEGVSTREQASALTLGGLWADRDRVPDPGPGVAYTFQLIGLVVSTEDGRELGTLEDVIATGAHPVYVVRGAKELLIPATQEVLKHVDLAGGRITVALPAGLEDI
jgi:16S rRNA processing protein RimM